MKHFFKDLFKNLIYTVLILICGVFVLNLFEIKFGLVVSGSMQPTLKKDDFILINPYKKIKVGEVLAFNVDGVGVITHRLLKIAEIDGQIFYLCAGDNNPFFVNINNVQVNIKNYKSRIDYLSSIENNEAISICENVVNPNQVVGVASLKFNQLGKYGKYINQNLWLIFVIIFILYLKNNQNMFKNSQKYLNI